MNFLIIVVFCITSSSSLDINYISFGQQVLKNYVTRILESSGNETKCVAVLKTYISDLTNSKKWALEMFDASAKLQSGLFTGNILQIGNFDQCLALNVNTSAGKVKGQYCTSVVTPSQKYGSRYETLLTAETTAQQTGINDTKVTTVIEIIKMSWGLCVPSICSIEELQYLWNYAEDYYKFKFHLDFPEDLCDYQDKRKDLSTIEIITICGGCVVLMLLIASTFYDIFIFQKFNDAESQYNIYTSFSLYTNIKRLFSTQEQEGTITCLSGIRAISMMWIVLGHRFVANALFPNMNSIHVFEWQKRLENTFLIGAISSVDTLLFLGGFLVVYIILIAQELGYKVTAFKIYVGRFVRIVPSLVATIFLYVGILDRLGNGPVWPIITTVFKRDCAKNWWSTLLFVQNYVHPLHMCIQQTYYIAIDTQLYMFAPLIIFAIVRWPKRTISSLVILIIVSAITTFGVSWIFDLNDAYATFQADYLKQMYLPTHVRFPPWVIGNIFGYYLYKNRNMTIIIKKPLVILLWIIAVSVMLVVIMAHIIFGTYSNDLLRTSTFNASYRILWALVLCWVIFACIHGYGGIVNKFLSLPIFTVLARLNYSMFLLHVAIIAIISAQKRTPEYLFNLTAFHQFWGDFVFTTGIAIMWTLAFESPMLIIQKIFDPDSVKHGNQNKKNKMNSVSQVNPVKK